jgi:hypothetical protein
MKWGFVPVTAYTGVVGAFLYVLGCREHERYVAARWRQALGSAMHCVAGDGVGILVGRKRHQKANRRQFHHGNRNSRRSWRCASSVSRG